MNTSRRFLCLVHITVNPAIHPAMSFRQQRKQRHTESFGPYRLSLPEDPSESISFVLGDISTVGLLSPEPDERLEEQWHPEVEHHPRAKRTLNDSVKDCSGKYKSLPSFDEERGDLRHRETSDSADTLVNPESLSNEREATRPGPGFWEHQMLVDRSLRIMAALTAVLAAAMVICCIIVVSRVADKTPSNSSSINLGEGQCSSVKRKSEVYLGTQPWLMFLLTRDPRSTKFSSTSLLRSC